MDIAARFEELSALAKARIIAAICAVCGVLMGFVLYIVFAHTFEQGEVATRVIALVVGLTVAMGVARLGEWLWETIATGQAGLGGHGKKAFTTAIFLVVIFELCASTVEDFAKMALNDANSVRAIAAKIAGERQKDFTLNQDQVDFPSLLQRLRAEARANGVRGPDDPPAATPEGRLIQAMGPETRWTIFAADADPSIADLTRVMQATRRATVWSMWGRTAITYEVPQECQDRGLGGLGAPGGASKLLLNDPDAFERLNAQREHERAADAKACLFALRAMPDAARLPVLRPALQQAVTNRALFAPESFPAAKGSEAASALAPQAALCAKIFAERPPSMKDLAIQDACVRVAEQAPEVAAANPGLMPSWQVAALNYKLLQSAMPEQFKPLPVYWSDFALLILVWCAAAVALGVFLVNGVFAITGSGPGLASFRPALMAAVKALLAAAIALGLSILAVRLGAYLWLLMFGEIPPRPDLPGILNVVNLVPWAVQSLREMDVWGVSIPGWVTLPVILGVLAMIAKDIGEPGDNAEAWWAFAALFGLLGLAAVPVLPGILGLMTIVAVSWIVPAFGLAVLLPYLEPAARVPRYWGLIALGAGLLLGLWAFLRLGQSDVLSEALMFATALFLIATGALIARNVAVRDLWPLLTVTVAFCLVGGTSVWQDATFKSILGALHETTASAPSAWTFQQFWFGDPQAGLPLAASPSEVDEAARLELALVGSLGFWVTIALLAAWSLRRKHEAGGTSITT